jgi:hypothetical protein
MQTAPLDRAGPDGKNRGISPISMRFRTVGCDPTIFSARLS